jgi:hypothetical protein
MEASIESATGLLDSLKAAFEEYKMVILVAFCCLLLLVGYVWFSRKSDASEPVLANMARVNAVTTGPPEMPSEPLVAQEQQPVDEKTPPGSQ